MIFYFCFLVCCLIVRLVFIFFLRSCCKVMFVFFLVSCCFCLIRLFFVSRNFFFFILIFVSLYLVIKIFFKRI